MILSTIKYLIWAWSVSCLKLQLKQNKCLFRESYSLIWGDRNDVLEFCPWRNVTEILILLLPEVDGNTVTQRIVCMLLFSQFWSAVWLCSKFYLLYREGRNGYWSVEGISGAIILMCLMMVSSDARTLQCVLAVKAWLNVISVYQVLKESQIIANPELALADEKLVLFR